MENNFHYISWMKCVCSSLPDFQGSMVGRTFI